MSFNKLKLGGYILAIFGFAIILFNALNYLMAWKIKAISFGIGIIFVAIGMAMIKKSQE